MVSKTVLRLQLPLPRSELERVGLPPPSAALIIGVSTLKPRHRQGESVGDIGPPHSSLFWHVDLLLGTGRGVNGHWILVMNRVRLVRGSGLSRPGGALPARSSPGRLGVSSGRIEARPDGLELESVSPSSVQCIDRAWTAPRWPTITTKSSS